MTTHYLTHSSVKLALHELQSKGEPNLLLLHGLGEHSPAKIPEQFASWPGNIYALDFTGHGDSTVPRGGGYTAELLMSDADIALAKIGKATVAGRGIGAYVAVLLAGGRPELVRGTILLDGPGLAGGGSGSTSPFIVFPDMTQMTPPDPFVLAELSVDVRPPDYLLEFVRLASQYSDLSRPFSICCEEKPEWLGAMEGQPGVEKVNLEEALNFYSQE
jgi:pimeloyl-ACP methyl ester carboxylesterase